ncbi:TAXI family TRAP transporter solute-binding subunit [Geodermatophilus sp. URMC 61]|uniref:TAXI family TRAP transporter solute-binding subunit n=1 Tax=Geodermatophilus sp. URMC 61 TaxID=3423411 RepID=UPI00406C22A6
MTSSPNPARSARRLLGTATAAALLLTACGGGDSGGTGGGEGAQAGGTLTFATGGTGGVYYPYGGGIANLLSSQLDGTVVTVQETNASVDNMQLLASGQAQLAFGLGDVVSDAANGENTFSEPLPICSLGNIYNNFTHVFTTAETGIKTIEDLRGKRVSPGAVGSASEVTADRIMQAAGIDPQTDIERAQLGVAETVAAIQDGTVDAGFWSGGLPTGAIVDLASTDDLVLIPTGEYADEMAQQYGDYYFADEIPANTYEGQAEPSPQVVSPNILVVREDMDEQLQQDIARTVFENKEQLLTVHPAAAELDPATADEVAFIETCPGAQAYFDSVG